MQVINDLHAFIWTAMSGNNCNTYLIDGPTRILIDPGHADAFGHVSAGLSELGLSLDDIGLVICTHGHPDHFEAATLFTGKNTLRAMHARDWQMISDMGERVPSAVKADLDAVEPDFFLGTGTLIVNGTHLEIFHVPGHSPGSVAVYWAKHRALFTGDVIFKGGLGRTDLPGGDGGLLKQSILRLKVLSPERILPGHGDMILDAGAVKRNFDALENYWFAHI